MELVDVKRLLQEAIKVGTRGFIEERLLV